MKKLFTLFAAIILSITALTGCDQKPDDPGTPPPNVLDPSISQGDPDNNSADAPAADSSVNGTGGESTESIVPRGSGVLENAVSVRIGNDGRKDWYINMYDNAASQTMLGYLTSSELRFPTYNYDEENGFAAQSVRGTYSRDDEITAEDVKAGELYLFSDRQLRLYFKDCAGVNITATPVGYFAETEGLADAVIGAYTSNLGDPWGVDVYFNITKRIS